ncbi:alpha/beta hydrolase [Neobacillus sp. PS3-34]|uniref:alpha/beta hydrolase n=1 Tax=Neobacillus sp. PS3-34 TaxID=3070678 RepID=UPI0027E16D7F|nr:alpha/beta hydrolase [Neobacillus sp. PS3-34]WML48394.1 alpha/beta hydrolase [Neobacillus sp. PS3-34]
MEKIHNISSGSTAWVDHIPVIWFEPQVDSSTRQLIIFLHHLGGSKETTIPYLEDLAAKGYVALSFDAWQHGERGKESSQEILGRVLGNFRRNMWPILGNTTLDTLRVIDWAVSTLKVRPDVYLGGLSMGGDIAVAAAGIDHRIKRVVSVVSTPDWLRPGMEDIFNHGTVMPAGNPDSYSQYFYDQLNPLTNLSSYANAPKIHFICGDKDTHVPPDGAFRFHSALRGGYPSAADRIKVTLLPDFSHLDVRDSKAWWPGCLMSLTHS